MPTSTKARYGNRSAVKRAENLTAGPWTRWRGSRHGKVIRFVERYCPAPRGRGYGRPLKLLVWQKEFIEQIYADGVDAAGLSVPRGGGKSTLGAALGAEAGFQDHEAGAPIVPVLATTIGQSIRSIYSTVEYMRDRSPELASRSVKYSGITNPRIYIPRTEGQIFPVSSDIDGLQGLDLTFTLVDEWGFLRPEVWSAVLMGRKRKPALVLGLGTPGLDRNNILHHVRASLKAGAKIPGFVYREYSGDPGADVRDEANWYRANPSLSAGFPAIEFLRSAVELTPEAHFRIFHLGQHDVDGVDGWLGADGRAVWNVLCDPWKFIDGAATWVGIDVGLYRDSTAIVAVQFRPDGRLHAKARIWMPAKGEPVDTADLMAHVRELCARYRVGAIAYDPRLFEQAGKALADEAYPMIEIPQSVERMTPAVMELHELIKAGRLSHDGDEAFTTQVLNGTIRPNERGYTLSKGKSRGHIDAAVALALAVQRAQHRTPPRPPVAVYWS